MLRLFTSMGHKQCTLMTFIEEGGKCLRNFQFINNEMEVQSQFSSITSSQWFSLRCAEYSKHDLDLLNVNLTVRKLHKKVWN